MRAIGSGLVLACALLAAPAAAAPQRLVDRWIEKDPVRLLGAGAIPADARGAFKLTLANDTRSALLVAPGERLERPVVGRAGSVLELAFAVARPAPVALRFRVALRVDGEDGVRVLLEERLAAGAAARWRDHALSLDALPEGRSGTLVLEASGPAGVSSAGALAAWGHPEILAPGPPPGPNLLLVSLDTVRADHLSLYGYERDTTPALAAWAREHATVFEQAVASASWTLPSHVSMLSGLDALHHGVNHPGPIPERVTLLAERLRAAGYRTVAVTGGGYVHPAYGFARGFDRFHAATWGVRAEAELREGTARAIGRLGVERERPFFLFFHTYEAHTPYRARAPYFDRVRGAAPGLDMGTRHVPPRPERGYRHGREPFLRRDGEALEGGPEGEELTALGRDLYDSGLAYIDRHLALVLGALDTLELSRRTVVAITSDHGELLGEHDTWNHLTVYDENLLVPLVIADPAGRGAGARVERQVRGVDLMPTVLDLMGLDVPDGQDGVSLLPLMEGRELELPEEAWSYAAASNHGISLRVGGRRKLILGNTPFASTLPKVERFDLRDDPREQRDLAGAGAHETSALRARIAARTHDRPAGPRLRLVRRGAEPGARLRLTLGFDDPLAATAWVKTAAARCDCASVRDDGTGIDVVAEAGRDLQLWLEGPLPAELPARLVLESASGAVLAERAGAFDPRALATRPLTLEVAPGVGVELGWSGPAPPAEAVGPPVATDERLLEQLRALGYVDR